MRTIYVDSDFKCHVTNDGTMTAVETDFFDGKCDAYIDGYCYNIERGAIYPWRPYSELETAQEEYESARLTDAENALAILLGGYAV